MLMFRDKMISFVIPLLAGFFFCLQPAFGGQPPAQIPIEYSQTEIIIKVKPDVEPRVQSAPNGNMTLGVSSLDLLARKHGLIKAKRDGMHILDLLQRFARCRPVGETVLPYDPKRSGKAGGGEKECQRKYKNLHRG